MIDRSVPVSLVLSLEEEARLHEGGGERKEYVGTGVLLPLTNLISRKNHGKITT